MQRRKTAERAALALVHLPNDEFEAGHDEVGSRDESKLALGRVLHERRKGFPSIDGVDARGPVCLLTEHNCGLIAEKLKRGRVFLGD